MNTTTKKKSNTSDLQFDLTIFERNGTECFGKSGSVHIGGCDHIIRMVLALHYYQALRRSNDMERQLLFINFISSVYKKTRALNDWIHFMKNHSHQIEEIHDELTSSKSKWVQIGGCGGQKGLTSCPTFHRHYNEDRRGKHIRNEDQMSNTEEGIRLVFWCELFDRIHHFLYHLFDTGMRLRSSAVDNLIVDTKSANYDIKNLTAQESVDKLFAMRRETLSIRNESLSVFNFNFRYDETKKNKFNLCTLSEKEKDIKQRKPFIDVVFEALFLMKSAQKMKVMHAIRRMIVSDEYDTDAIVDDIGRDGLQSNLIGCNRNTEWKNTILHLVKTLKLSPIVFSTGFTWFYWESYRERIPQVPGEIFNPNDYGGYTAKELFVKPRYANYKEEILQHIPISDYHTFVAFKVRNYMKSQAVKAFKVKRFGPYIFHYGYKAGDTIKRQHICSIVLYCDFTEYSTRFSATFRKLDRWESIESVKCRNAEYYWQSRYLRETVELFGMPDYGKWDAVESGPFFCGVDCVMVFPAFSIRLCGPTSTSKKLEVAMNFAQYDDDGVILTLNNNGNHFGKMLAFFDCSWLSNHADEDERLFVGGGLPIRVENILIVNTDKEYLILCHLLWIWDCMLQGTLMGNPKLPSATGQDEEHRQLLSLHDGEILLWSLLTDNVSLKLDKYIVNTFKAYRETKKQIKVTWYLMDKYKYDQRLVAWMVHTGFEAICVDEKPSKSMNLLHANVFKMFYFTEEYIINTISNWFGTPETSYKFDLIAFLEIIVDGSWIRIIIEDFANSWIGTLWKSKERQEICEMYAQRGFAIVYDTGVWDTGGTVGVPEEWGGFNKDFECLIITRKEGNAVE